MSRKRKAKRSKLGSKKRSPGGSSPPSPEVGSAPNRAGVVVGIGGLFALMLAVVLLGPREQIVPEDVDSSAPELSDLEVWQQAPEHAIDVSPAKDPVLGPVDAPVTVVEYSDFQCPFCRESSGAFKYLVEKYEGKIRLVFKDFPLDTSCNDSLGGQLHPLGCRAATMAHCALARGKFWEMHDALFKLREMTPEALEALPGELGLESATFSACLEDEATLQAVKEDIEEGKSIGVNVTPSLFVNGRQAPNYWNDSLESIIDHVLASGSP